MRRPTRAFVAVVLAASGLVFVAGGAHEAEAAAAAECRMVEAQVAVPATAANPETTVTASVLSITVADASTLAVSRTPGSSGQGGGRIEVRVDVPATGPPATCTDAKDAPVTPTIGTVDTVEIRATGTTALTLTIDLANGLFAPGRDASFDLFGPGFAEDASPEIEFDVHLPHGGVVPFLTRYPAATVEILGSNGPDHLVVGQRTCPDFEDPRCRDVVANLNAAADDDADLFVTSGEANEVNAAQTPTDGQVFATVGGFLDVRAEGRGGNDVLDARGTGIGSALGFVRRDNTGDRVLGGRFTADGGDGNDVIYGGAAAGDPVDGDDVVDDQLDGGAGNDRIEGGPGNDRINGGPGDDVLVGGPGNDQIDGGVGDDVIDEGPELNGADITRGGDGRDRVDYSERTVELVPLGKADVAGFRLAGEANENDRIHLDVEEVRLPTLGSSPGLRVVGEMPALKGHICKNSQGTVDVEGPCPLIVDSSRNLAVSIGQAPTQSGPVWVRRYDLRFPTRDPVDIPCPGKACSDFNPDRSALDPLRARVYSPPPPWPALSPSDQPGHLSARNRCELYAIDYSDPAKLTPPRPVVYATDGVCPPASPNFVTLAVAATADPPGLLLSGAPKEEFAVRRNDENIVHATAGLQDFTVENAGQPLLIRRVLLSEDDPGTPSVEIGTFGWDLDLRGAGCGRRPQMGSAGLDPPLAPFVAQVGSDLLAYCWDYKFTYWNDSAIISGPQGYLVRIPLGPNHRPLGLDGKELAPMPVPYTAYRAVRTPTLPGHLEAVVDRASGLVALVTEGSINGNAVWLFDPKADRFVGVVSGGAAESPRGNTAVGFDPSRGRMYLSTKDGVLVAPTRQRPLPAGIVSPAGRNPTGRPGWINSRQIVVAPDLHRLFIPINFPDQGTQGARFVVVEDEVPDPPFKPPSDLDANTTQMDETAGLTEVRANAQGSASGAHVVWTGGANRTLRSGDPACFTSVPISEIQTITVDLEPQVLGTCVADFALSPGHREFSVGASEAEAGSGSVAHGSPLAFASTDVTSDDLKARGSCEVAVLQAVARGNLPPSFTDPYGDACDGLWDGITARRSAEDGSRGDDPSAHPDDPRRHVPDPREGTGGRDGRGAVLSASRCSDFSGTGSEHDASFASAACNHGATAARASARGSGLSLDAGGLVVSAASTTSSVTTGRTEEGQVTLAAASAKGVVVGPLSIREVRALAITKAKGRTNTAAATLERRWCGVSLIEDAASGVPPELGAQVEALRRALPPPVRAFGAQTIGCIDPAHPDNAALIEAVNQLLLGKARLSITDPNEEVEANGETEPGQDSPGGYQAVLIKHPDAVGGDSAVNDDASSTVAALEITLYNDGPQGRNRVIVQLAGVHAESRYGVTLLPQFAGLDGSFSSGTAAEGTPSTRRVIPGTRQAPSAATIIEGEAFEELFSTSPLSENPIRRFLGFLPEALKDLWRLFVQHPLEFLLLFFVFSLLGTPAYLAYRRRTFVGVVAG